MRACFARAYFPLGPWAPGPLGPWALGPLGPWALGLGPLGPWALGPGGNHRSKTAFGCHVVQSWAELEPICDPRLGRKMPIMPQ